MNFFFPFGRIFFNLTCSFAAHHEQSFVFVFFKVSNDHLFDNPESGKEILIFVFKNKTLDPKICTNPAKTWKIVVMWLEYWQ